MWCGGMSVRLGYFKMVMIFCPLFECTQALHLCCLCTHVPTLPLGCSS